MKKLLIAGGLCGTTMLIAAEKVEARCARYGVDIKTVIQNLWETAYVAPGYDLIIEMFPYFENAACPVLDGKPLICHVGERELVERAAAILCGVEEAAS